MTLTEFEQATNTTPTQAARLLGIAYPRYNEFKNGTRKLKPYHMASMLAHAALSGKAMAARKKQAGVMP